MTAQPETAALKLTVNAQAVCSVATTLEDLIVERGHGAAKIATAINGAFVPARARAQTRLQDGDCIEIVSARQGG